MKITQRKLKQLIREEIQVELNEELLNEGWYERLVNWLVNTTAGNQILDKANSARGMDQVAMAYGKRPKK
jgi:hypothetical protein